jgi:hypothetical protein
MRRLGLFVLFHLTKLPEDAAGEENVALALRVLGEERYLVVLLLQRDLFVAVLETRSGSGGGCGRSSWL